MFNLLKRLLPLPVKKRLRYLKSVSIDQCYKKYLSIKMQRKHQILIKKASKKSKIKVVFLAFHQSTWKVDTVFNKMLNDPFFEPLILVCPYTVYGEENMWQEMSTSLEFFKSKQYPVLSSFNQTTKKWITLDELDTDIVFFTNPHNLTKKEYYQDAYLNYLSCFCGYGYIVSEYNNAIPNFNQPFHAALWRNFVTDKFALEGFKKYSINNGSNTYLTGFPAIEPLLLKNIPKTCWKQNKENINKLKIIYAPHHTIFSDFELQLSNFLKFSNYIKDLAKTHQHEIQWCFKPHPLLKSKLYLHPDWGIERTDNYYNWWKNQSYTQKNEGEYEGLFTESDAMIHDSGSFLIEYLTQKKPVMYLVSSTTKNTLNTFSLNALEACHQGQTKQDINDFIHGLLNRSITIKKSHDLFYQNEFNYLYENQMPSDRILLDIKQSIIKK